MADDTTAVVHYENCGSRSSTIALTSSINSAITGFGSASWVRLPQKAIRSIMRANRRQPLGNRPRACKYLSKSVAQLWVARKFRSAKPITPANICRASRRRTISIPTMRAIKPWQTPTTSPGCNREDPAALLSGASTTGATSVSPLVGDEQTGTNASGLAKRPST